MLKKTLASIINKYVTYVLNYYQQSTVVFDGYPEEVENRCTKSTERLRELRNLDYEVLYIIMQTL